ncbi:MAG: SRPBCC family protein [Gammaproteobacteria bacterium]|nr:SRPBCC family protein [Gammaproteobacteria bacterium]
MAQQRIEIVQDYNKPLAQVFASLADHNNLSRVFGIPVKRIKDGAGDVNGVGSVRRLGFSPLAVEETVVDMQPNQSIDYRITRGGGPVRNHHGRLTFSSVGNGTRVNWVITFDSPVPLLGPVVRKVLTQGIRMGLQRIA